MSIDRRWFALSEHPLARLARGVRRQVCAFTLPAPRVVVRPLVGLFVGLRALFHFAFRVFVCEPFFKAHCSRVGRRVRTGVFLHWIQGRGELIVGDDVLVDGKCSFSFAARFSDRPRLEIGDRTGIGHGCAFVVAREMRIGRDCRIASGVKMFDASGHPSDPAARLAGEPPAPEEVRPVAIEDNVWIGRDCLVFPGVTIGEGSVVSAGSVVMADVPAYSVVAGNPARRVSALSRPDGSVPTTPGEERREA